VADIFALLMSLVLLDIDGETISRRESRFRLKRVALASEREFFYSKETRLTQ
jgi:hypothetical protein